eukprot:NODE_868_length_3404_cov_1.096218.p2 type:complete len:112 gc:universal NODE_868_length_3404_cov_1.096218:62-397(+)
MMVQQVLPCGFQYKKQLADTVHAVQSIKGDTTVEMDLLTKIGNAISECHKLVRELDLVLKKINELEGREAGVVCKGELVPIMDQMRVHADILEELVDDKLWPYPKYLELLY